MQTYISLFYHALFHFRFDVAGKREKGFLNVCTRLGGCLHKFNPILDSQLFTPFFGHLQISPNKNHRDAVLSSSLSIVYAGLPVACRSTRTCCPTTSSRHRTKRSPRYSESSFWCFQRIYLVWCRIPTWCPSHHDSRQWLWCETVPDRLCPCIHKKKLKLIKQLHVDDIRKNHTRFAV